MRRKILCPKCTTLKDKLTPYKYKHYNTHMIDRYSFIYIISGILLGLIWNKLGLPILFAVIFEIIDVFDFTENIIYNEDSYTDTSSDSRTEAKGYKKNETLLNSVFDKIWGYIGYLIGSYIIKPNVIILICLIIFIILNLINIKKIKKFYHKFFVNLYEQLKQ